MSIKNGYHYDDFRKRYFKDEDGIKIPEEQCLCFAHEPSECCCDCTSWDSYREDEGYEDYEDKERKVNDYGTN